MDSRPDRAFRIADRRHRIFDGTGAYLHGGRWNSPGRRVIYAADTFPGAMLELLVHTRTGRIPNSHAWVEVHIPSTVSLERVDTGGVRNWRTEGSTAARNFGDRWYDEGRSLVLIVPSVVTSALTHNLLINQDHPEFPLLRPSRPRAVHWDSRLFLPSIS